MTDFLTKTAETIGRCVDAFTGTCRRIDSVTFTDMALNDWLGYAHYVMGTPLYTLFSTVLLIAIGITIWTYVLKGIKLLLSILPLV